MLDKLTNSAQTPIITGSYEVPSACSSAAPQDSATNFFALTRHHDLYLDVCYLLPRPLTTLKSDLPMITILKGFFSLNSTSYRAEKCIAFLKAISYHIRKRTMKKVQVTRKLPMLVQFNVNDAELPAFMNIIEHLRSDMIESISILDPDEASFVVSSKATVRERVQAAEARGNYTDHDTFWNKV